MDALQAVLAALRSDYLHCCFMVAITAPLPKNAWLVEDAPYYSLGANREAVRDTHGERIQPMRDAYEAYHDFGGNMPMAKVHRLEDAARRRFLGDFNGGSDA